MHTHTHMLNVYMLNDIYNIYTYIYICIYTHTHTHTHTYVECVQYVCIIDQIPKKTLVHAYIHTYIHIHVYLASLQ